MGDLFSLEKRVRPPLSPFTLGFSDTTLEDEFNTHHTIQTVGMVRFSIYLAVFLYVCFAILDLYIVTEKFVEVGILRIITITIFLITLRIIREPWAMKQVQFIVSIVVFFASLGIIYMIFISESIGGSNYYAGLILASVFAHVLLRLRFIYATLLTWFFISLYVMWTHVHGVTPSHILMNNAYFLVSANIMGMFASYWLEYYMRAVYWQNRILTAKSIELEIEHTRKSRELEAARQIQMSILPTQQPQYPGYDIAMGMQTATEVGGDYYDYALPECGAMILAVGDATGHGAQAGAMVTAMKILFTDHCKYMDMRDFMTRASRTLRQTRLRKLYMAFGMVELYDQNKAKLVGAGLPPALVYRAVSGEVDTIPMKGMPLGSPVDYPYQEYMTDLNRDDVLLVYTDGLPELFNSQGTMMGYDTMASLLREYATMKSAAIKDALMERARQWSPVFNDDVTLAVIKRL